MVSSSRNHLSSLSVFIPCFNEEQNVVPLVTELMVVLPKIADRYEIIIIDDGSRDATGHLADKLAHINPVVRCIHHSENQGYGATLRTGFAAARYDWTFFTDSDRQFNIQELAQFIPYTNRFSVIIGYRKKRAEGGLRSFNAGLYKLYIDVLFRVHVKDIDCAFKLIKTDLIKQIHFISTGATINAELLYRLKKMRIPFKQLPVNHFPRLHGTPTGNHPRVVIQAGLESIKLYAALKLGWKFT